MFFKQNDEGEWKLTNKLTFKERIGIVLRYILYFFKNLIKF